MDVDIKGKKNSMEWPPLEIFLSFLLWGGFMFLQRPDKFRDDLNRGPGVLRGGDEMRDNASCDDTLSSAKMCSEDQENRFIF